MILPNVFVLNSKNQAYNSRYILRNVRMLPLSQEKYLEATSQKDNTKTSQLNPNPE